MNYRGTKYSVLFLGSGNAARSIMAEAILDREGCDKFQAYSAGIHAKDALDTNAEGLLKRLNFDTAPLRAKNWNELAGDGAPQFDFIFTVCDSSVLLPRSMWQGQPMFAHWGVADPAKAQGKASEIKLAYADTFRMLSNRVGIFVNLPLASLDRRATQRELNLIGGNRDKAAVVAA
jgi:arsenate reductase